MTEAAPATDAGQADNAPADNGQGDSEPANDTKAWYDVEGITDEQKGFLETKGWTDKPLELVKGYQELEKFRGVSADKLLTLPEDMTAEGAMSEIYDRLGRPENEESYEAFKVPEGAAAVDEGRMAFANKMAYGMGLNQAQRDAMVSATMEYETALAVEQQKTVELEQTAQLNEVKAEWKGQYAEREELGRRAVRAILPDGVDKGKALTAIEEALGTAVFLKMFANAGEHMGEDKITDSGEGGQKFGFSPEQAAHEKKELMDLLKSGSKEAQERVRVYNTGKGADFERITTLNKLIHGVK